MEKGKEVKEHLIWLLNKVQNKNIQCENRHYTSAMRSFQCQKEQGHFGKCADVFGRELIPNNEPKPKKQPVKQNPPKEA
jgi:hypothetical protein